MIFRAARHTDNLDDIKMFYCSILGMDLLGEFNNHDNYEGIFIGKQNCDWHLEFTKSDKKALHTFDEDDLYVFYTQTIKEFNEITSNLKAHKIKETHSPNPYWNLNGHTYLDPDGFSIVIVKPNKN